MQAVARASNKDKVKANKKAKKQAQKKKEKDAIKALKEPLVKARTLAKKKRASISKKKVVRFISVAFEGGGPFCGPVTSMTNPIEACPLLFIQPVCARRSK